MLKNIVIYTTDKVRHTFTGRYLPEREKPNWHYYETDKNEILHFRKEHIIMVVETGLEK